MVSRGEIYTLELYKRKKNSAYEYEERPKCVFKGRPAKNVEKGSYSVQNGVMNGTEDTFIFATTLPTEVTAGDRVFYLGKFWQVSSVGVYLEELRLVNASIMDDKKLMEKAPKGLTLK